MAEVITVNIESSRFPHEDISEAAATRLAMMLSHRTTYEAVHNVSESQPAMRWAHALLRSEARRQLKGGNDASIGALSLGIGAFEGLCVMAAPGFITDTPDRIEVAEKDGLLDLLVEARDAFVGTMPNSAEAVAEVASREFGSHVEYALAGAALMRSLVLPDRQAA